MPNNLPARRSVVARLTDGFQQWARRPEPSRLSPANPVVPGELQGEQVNSRPSLQPYAHGGVAFSPDVAPDLRARLRELVRMSAQIIHVGFVRSAEVDDADSLIDEGEPAIMLIDKVRPLAEQLHAEARAQLMDAYLDASEQLFTDRIFRSLTDVLSALHSAETAIVALRLLRNHNDAAATVVNAAGEEIVHEVARRAVVLAEQTAQALAKSGDPHAAIDAAMAIRGVRSLFDKGDCALKQPRDILDNPLALFGQIEYRRRVCRAALWSVMLCSESMARVAARFAMTADEHAAISPVHSTQKAPRNAPTPVNPYESMNRPR